VASGLLSVPFHIITSQLSPRTDFVSVLLQVVLQGTGLILSIYLTLALKRFLNTLHTFHETDGYIEFMVTTILIFNTAVIAGILLPAWKIVLTRFALLLLVSFGVSQVLFAVKLLRASGIQGYSLKLFCSFSVCSGFFLATVVLLKLGILAGAATDIMLGVMFLRTGSKPGLGTLQEE
jgi:hypothetical protein